MVKFEFCNSYLLKFPLKKEENSMKETNIIYDSVSNTWSIIVKVVNKSLLQIEYPELTGYKTKEEIENYDEISQNQEVVLWTLENI